MKLYVAVSGYYPSGTTIWQGLADSIIEAVEFAKKETGNSSITFENVGLA